jgi:hypothetical protein
VADRSVEGLDDTTCRQLLVHKPTSRLSPVHRFRADRLIGHLGTHASGVKVSTGSAQQAFRGHRRLAGWRRMSYGLYIEDREPSRLADGLRAWILMLPTEAAFTHLTAAELRGWWLPQPISHPVFAALRHGDPCRHRAGLLVSRHLSRVPSELVSDIRLTRASETLLAAARDLGELDLVLMGDSALRLGHCTVDEHSGTASPGRSPAPPAPRHARRAERVAWESVMRVLHRAADIPVEPQHEIFDQWGRFVARGDLWIVGTNRLHEFDGGVHRDPATQSRDLARDRRLIEAGCQRFGFTKAQVLNDGGSISASTDTLLGRRLGSCTAAPVECTCRRLDVRLRESHPSAPPLAGVPITVGRLHSRACFGCNLPAVKDAENQTIIWRALGGIGRGSLVEPDRYSSTPAAQARPSAIAQTIND